MKELHLEDLTASTLREILAMVHKLTGISMDVNKKTMLQGRLRPRIRKLGLTSYTEYLDYLKTHKLENQEFINLVTTNETSFFRTQRVWDYFLNEYLPKWSAANPNKRLKIWSAAASTGEEVYTIGICCEEFKLLHPNFDYQIYGTDISADVLEAAEAGEYSGRSIESFKKSGQALFDKYLKLNNKTYNVSAGIRSKIRFGLHNLFHPPVVREHYDIVFLRNVLIYFKEEDQKIVLSQISKSMALAGVLVIGESESLSSLKTCFRYRQPLVYEKVEDFV